MSIITITTDLGYRDSYLAMVKGVLYSKLPQVNIVDLACDINKHNHKDGVFILRNALPFFPENSIHLFAIKSGTVASPFAAKLVGVITLAIGRILCKMI